MSAQQDNSPVNAATSAPTADAGVSDPTQMTVRELLSMLNPHPQQDTQANWEKMERVLGEILDYAGDFYEARESHIRRWAVSIAWLAVKADGFDEDDAKHLINGMGKLARHLLWLLDEVKGEEEVSPTIRRGLEAIAATRVEEEPTAVKAPGRGADQRLLARTNVRSWRKLTWLAGEAGRVMTHNGHWLPNLL